MEINMAASDYWNAFVQAAKRSSEENAAKQNAARVMVGASPINYDYNIIDFARDVSPVGAAMNMSSALGEGDYKTAGLNAALLGAEVLPPLKWGVKGINRLAGSPALRGALHPAMWKQGQYTKDQIGDMWKTFQGKPVGPLAAGSAPLSEAAQVNKLMADNINRINTKDLYEFSRKKFRQKYMDELDDPSYNFMSLMHSSKRPDLTLDNFDFGSVKTADFGDALKHKAIAPDPIFNKGLQGIFAKQVADADEFLTDPHYRDFLNRYIVTSGYKRPPLGPGSMNLERRAGAPMSQKMGLRQYDKQGNIIFTPSTKNEIYEYFVPAQAIKETGGIDNIYSLENITDYLGSLK